MTAAQYKEYLEFAKDIALAAGKLMLKYFKAPNTKYKSDQTPVTLADTEINSYLIKRVKEKYPAHSVDGEEEAFGKSNHIWVCDPVDGTRQFAAGIPVSTFSLALVIDGVSVVGVVYEPFAKDLYYATKGGGAFKNGKRINVSQTQLGYKECIMSYDYFNTEFLDIWKALTVLKSRASWVCLHSCIRGFMAVADGSYAGAIFPGTTHKNCDAAAAKIIVEEAGGLVRNFYGQEDRMDGDIKGAIVTNRSVYDEVLKTLSGA